MQIKFIYFYFFPVLDTFRVFVLRLIKNRSIFKADKTHFHHLIIEKFGYLKVF